MKLSSCKIRILILDADDYLRRCTARLLDHESDLEVCAEAALPEEATPIIVETHPDVAVVNSDSLGERAPEIVGRLGALFPALPVIVLSLRDHSVHGQRMLEAGAAKYLNQSDAARELVPAIRQLLAHADARPRRDP